MVGSIFRVEVERDTASFYFGTAPVDQKERSASNFASFAASVAQHKRIVIRSYLRSSDDVARNVEIAKQQAVIVREAFKAAGIAEEKIEILKPTKSDGGAGAQADRVDAVLE